MNKIIGPGRKNINIRRAKRTNPEICRSASDSLNKIKYLAVKNGYRNIAELTEGIMDPSYLYYAIRYGVMRDKYLEPLELRLKAKRKDFLYWLNTTVQREGPKRRPSIQDAIDLLRDD